MTMAYTRQDLLALAAQTRALAQDMRAMQHDEDCSRALRPALKEARHHLGTVYRSMNLAAEHKRDDAARDPSPDLTGTIDRIQVFYRFTDFRTTDRTTEADKARAALMYVLAHDEGFAVGQIAKALKRDDAAVCKSRDRAHRAVLDAMNSHQTNDIARYVAHMRAILKGKMDYAMRDVVAR